MDLGHVKAGIGKVLEILADDWGRLGAIWAAENALTAVVLGLLILAGVAKDKGRDVRGGEHVRHGGRSYGCDWAGEGWQSGGLETCERAI